jgi:hypothetical protein
MNVLTYKSSDRVDSPLMIGEDGTSERGDFHRSFAKYTECTICLNVFENE